MRLLRHSGNDDFVLVSFTTSDTPPYAILSHTWIDGEEVTYDELVVGAGKNKLGFAKIRFCGERASKDGLQYFWVDTCCIDKRNSTELTEAINSMFRWYRNATKCYVYLSDVCTYANTLGGGTRQSDWESDFRKSRWFTRGWTLQELLAPASVLFFSFQHDLLGDKVSLDCIIHEITGIPIPALHGRALDNFTPTERIAWSGKRRTTKDEDGVYCLFGIFGVFMPIIYGEGVENALRRFQREVDGLRLNGTADARSIASIDPNPQGTHKSQLSSLHSSSEWRPHFYFFYGATQNPRSLASRLKLKSMPTLYDARLPNCSVASWRTWKVLLDGPTGHFAHGKAYLVESAAHDRKLRSGETGEFRLEHCKMLVMFEKEEQEFEAKVFKFYGRRTDLTNIVQGAKPFEAHE